MNISNSRKLKVNSCFTYRIAYIYCEQSSKWNNRLLSISLLQWYHLIKLSSYWYRWKWSGESKERERERERERECQNNRVSDKALVGNGDGVGQKWPLVKSNSWVFLSNQINRTSKVSITLGGSLILQFGWCHNIWSHDAMFCHTFSC